MMGCKPTDTPMETTSKLDVGKESAPMDKGRYKKLLEKLIYLSHTRSDIGFPVSVVNQFMNDPRERHLKNCISDSKISKVDSRQRANVQENSE